MGAHHATGRRWGFCPRAAATAAVLLVIMGVLSATPASATTGTYVRLAQLTADMPGSELLISSISRPQYSVMIPGVGYGDLSDYRRIDPGDYVVSVRPVGSGPPLVSTTLAAKSGAAYTLAAVGGTIDRGLTIYTDDLTPPAAGQTRVRVINAAEPQSAGLDIRGPAGELFASALPAGKASDYRSVPAGSLALDIGPHGGPSSRVPITVGANQVVSAVLTSSNGVVAASVRVDADGPAALPPGPVNAGFGGAERPGGPVAMIAFLALAAVAAACSGVLATRNRRGRHRPC